MENNTLTPLPSGSCIAIVVAAGRGLRAGGDIPKQYQPLAGKPLLRHTLEALTAHPGIDAVCPVIGPGDEELLNQVIAGLDVLPFVYGSETRQESVLCGLQSISAFNPARILIHDGARPFPVPALISNVIEALDEHDGAVPALPVVDTLKRSDTESRILETVSREDLWRAQTPQGFRFDALLKAYDQVPDALHMTDDASIAEAAGLNVILVDGDERNIKVTAPADFKRAQAMMFEMETRVGSGFDVHRFCAGDSVRLCGVAIPFDRALEGHSDADVAMHALCDAIFGALGDGDIGVHFSPGDEQWRGVSSDVFLRHAMKCVRTAGGRLINADITIICQKPLISPHRDEMRRTLVRIMSVAEKRISVKATTTERLGFTGREEGIAAQATATLALPGGLNDA